MIRPMVVLIASLGPSLLEAQARHPEPAIAAFVEAARAATARYRDQTVALREGYRRIGPDFPSMGEHWLNRSLVMRGSIDPGRPPILEYITVDGRPVLAGVAYAGLAYAAPPASSIPAAPAAWHYHAGSVDEESFLTSHASGGAAAQSDGGPRIAVLHAWIWLENEAGLFATDNWALPWIRLGLEPPSGGQGPVAETLSAALAAEGEAYFSSLLRIRERLTAEDALRVAATLQRHASAIRSLVAARPDDLRPALAQGWAELENEIREFCPRCTPVMPAH